MKPVSKKQLQSDIEILLKKTNGEPFVIKKDGEYFIQMVKYTDDPQILLDAIKNVQVIDFDTLMKREVSLAANKAEYWQHLFNYQYNNGGLVMWENPTEIFEQHLARLGKSLCPDCGGTRIMYYRPICPKCLVPKKDKKGRVQFFEVVYVVAEKNKINPQEFFDVIFGYDQFNISNDTVVDFYFTEDENVNKYLRMINAEFPLESTNFFVSW